MPCETWVYRFIFFFSSLHPFVNDEKKRVENIPKKYKYIIKQNSRLKSLYVNEYWILCWLKPILGTCNNKKIWNQQIIVFYLLVFLSSRCGCCCCYRCAVVAVSSAEEKGTKNLPSFRQRLFHSAHFLCPISNPPLIRCHYFSLEFSTIHLLSRFILIFFGCMLFIHGVNKKRSKIFFALLADPIERKSELIAKHTRLQDSQAQ